MRLQLALALTEDISGKKGAIKCRARSDKRGRIEKRNRTFLRKPGRPLPVGPSIKWGVTQIGDSSLSPTVDRPFSFQVFDNRTLHHVKS